MRLVPGEKIKNIVLPAIDGSTFDMDMLKGKPFMLSFLRFATCPFCNLRVNQLVKRFDEFGEDFTIIAIFDSSIDHLKKHASGHKAPFPILADQENVYYQKYGIEKSLFGMLKGMILRFPTLIKGMLKGYLPNLFKANLIIMPADFLVDREGRIQVAYYGADEGDHLPFDQIKAFSQSEMVTEDKKL